jgi:hypothetical protein
VKSAIKIEIKLAHNYQSSENSIFPTNGTVSMSGPHLKFALEVNEDVITDINT